MPTSATSSRDTPPRQRSGVTDREVLIILTIVMVLVVISVNLPGVSRGRVSPDLICLNKLKQIGCALLTYHDDYGVLPPAYTVDSEGKPLHSWRTLLLPYLDRKGLYHRLDLSKPWNAPENASVFENQSWLQCPSLKEPSRSQTTYLAIVTDTSCIRVGRSLSLSEVIDGLSKTICVIEVRQDQAVPWMEPRDLDEAWLQAICLGKQDIHAYGRSCLRMDAATRFLSRTMPLETVKALATAAGGEDIDEF